MKRFGLLRRLWRTPGGRVGLVVLALLCVVAAGADVLAVSSAPSGPTAPSLAHWLGTDALGRDVLTRLVGGTRAALGVGAISVTLVTVLGVGLGALSGFYGGRIDDLVTRFVEILLSYPTMLAVLAVRGITDAPGMVDIALVIGLLRWTDIARLTRAEVMRAKQSDHAVAAHALGATPLQVLWRHVLPDALTPAWVSIPSGFAAAVLMESTLSFLGVGVPETIASWGETLGEARVHHDAWWLAVFPGLAMFVVLSSLARLGEALRDALDPRRR